MATDVDVWWRNPSGYLKELVESGENRVIFDKGFLIKKRIDADKIMRLHYMSKPYKYRILGWTCVEQFDSESIDAEARYPVWEYGDDLAVLEDYLANPPGNDKAKCNDQRVAASARPIFGQDNIVYINSLPDLLTNVGKKFLSTVRDMQLDYPGSQVVPHGAYGAWTMIGMGFKSIDWEARHAAANGVLYLPTGKQIRPAKEKLAPYAKWITLLGFLPVDMNDARKRCLFNIKSLRWAANNYNSNSKFAFRLNKSVPADSTTPEQDFEPPTAGSYRTNTKYTVQPGDKYVCNSCSLMYDCKLFREGAVCSLPNSETGNLAKFFRTRNSGDIIDGLSALVQLNAERAASGIESEEDFGLDPHVTQIIDQTFKQGTKLAQLIDPALRSPKMQVNVGVQGNAAIQVGDMGDLIASAVRELERSGIPRDRQTPEMVEALLTQSGAIPKFDGMPELEGPVYDAEVVE